MNNNISIVLSGEAGQGIKTVEKLLIHTLRNEGIHFFSTSELMSRVRGGNNSTLIRIGNENIQSFRNETDVLIVLGKNGINRLEKRLSQNTIIIGDKRFIDEKYATNYSVKFVPFMKIADKCGNPILSNTVVYGYISGILNVQADNALPIIEKTFKSKENSIADQNKKAYEEGYILGQNSGVSFSFERYESVKKQAILNGTESIGIGALAGGCNFSAAYPMSPGTGVLQFLAEQQDEFGIVVEQAEDEIAAINMTAGAWYAGARAITTTSGGGFALMEEGISLSGMIEIPAVVHIGMRPGPATGLPTRTEQGDLLLSVFAGHGEFPKIVLAPGSFDDGIEITRKAFEFADKYRVPVIILSDQYFLDSYHLVDKPDNLNETVKNDIIQTDKDYKTYAITKDGISPRGVPGRGDGFVCVDSDEHDETGRLTESADVRVQMMDKRMRKNEAILDNSIEPELLGDEDYETLIIGWGSTYGVLKEAVNDLNDEKIAFAHFKQVFPLPRQTGTILKKAKNIILFENNATGQFAKIIAMETGIRITQTVLQYDGNPFSIEFVKRKITEYANENITK